MALKIRLRQQGRTNRSVYRVVVTDCRAARDGKYVEMVGWYNPLESEMDKQLFLKPDRIQYWMNLGAQVTEKTKALLEKAAPALLKSQVEREVAKRAKEAVKRKARKERKNAA